MGIGESHMKTNDVLAELGLAVGILSLAAQLTAPKCPTCGRRVVVVNNYCTHCKIQWK